MKMRWLLLISFLLLGSGAEAGEKITLVALTYPGKRDAVPARLYLVLGPGPFPGVSVIQAAAGIMPEIYDYAEKASPHPQDKRQASLLAFNPCIADLV